MCQDQVGEHVVKDPIQITTRTVRVNGLAGWPDGVYVYGEDVISILLAIGMARSVDLAHEVNELRKRVDQ